MNAQRKAAIQDSALFIIKYYFFFKYRQIYAAARVGLRGLNFKIFLKWQLPDCDTDIHQIKSLKNVLLRVVGTYYKSSLISIRQARPEPIQFFIFPGS